MASHIVLVSREVAPFGGGGIGVYVTSLARVLQTLGDVTIVTSELHREASAACERGPGPSQFPVGVELSFVEEPEEDLATTDYRRAHEWSVRVWDALRELCGQRRVDLVEFADWGGEGCVTLQARRTRHNALRDTLVCVRAHSTVELNDALNGHVASDIEALRLYDLERYSLGYADVMLWAGGDILPSYQRFYGKGALAAAARIRHPAPTGVAAAGAAARAAGTASEIDYAGDALDSPARPAAEAVIRLLYLGRLERRKGIERLIRALREVESGAIELTIVGADTATGPLGVPMRDLAELGASGDQRISFGDACSRAEILDLIAGCDVGVLPSVWECWPTVVLEFLGLNRPVLATPTGGPLEMIEHDSSGWLTADASTEAIAASLDALAAEPEQIAAITASGAPRSRFEALTGEAAIVDGYRDLLDAAARTGREATPRAAAKPARTGQRRRAVPERLPLVSIIVTYFAMEEHIEETVASLVAQEYAPLEIIVVNDGSFDPADVILDRLVEAPYEVALVTQENGGLAAARNFGIRQSQGRYFLPFDADNLLDPSFVARAVEVLESDPEVAYVTSWERVIDEHGEPAYPADWRWHYRFVSNFCSSLGRENIAGDAPAIFRRSLFDRGYAYVPTLAAYEDWHLYQRLAADGHYGHVIPEPLISYRVRSESILRRVALPYDERLRGEMAAAHTAHAIGWAAP